ncbi:hypothetical protein CHS0354_022331 [Potamilus streckersoni]|uniref:Uncharacterized protein n=1 Tax=Potamilus streckersoni TaxID=2493646 RepID=A0AAE0TIK5_9BIVA|nr:hypothetical protein CHS0354_022331 [Potamilus streckersoni]
MSKDMRRVTKNKVRRIQPQEVKNTFTLPLSDGTLDQPSICNIMKPIIWSMVVFGIYHRDKRMEIRESTDGNTEETSTIACTCASMYSTLIYNVIVTLLSCCGLLRISICLSIGGASTVVFIFEIVVLLWFFLCTVNGIIFLKFSHYRYGRSCVFYKHWEEMVANFSELKIEYDTKKLRRVFMITFVSSWFLIGFNIVGGAILLFNPFGDGKEAMELALTSPFPATTSMKIAALIFHIYFTGVWILPAAYVLVINLAIKYGFLALCDAMEKEVRLSKDRLTDRLQDFRKVHMDLCRCIEILDKDFNILNASWYVVAICATCLILYTLINFGGDIFFNIIFTFWLLSGLGYAAVTSFFSASLHETVQGPLDALLKTSTNGITPEKQAQLNLFLAKLTVNNTGFTVLTLVTITKELLLTMTGLFLTYFFLLTQFNI